MKKTAYVKRAAYASFPESQREEALAALRKYRWRRERDRVKLAIIVLANGDMKELKRLVQGANEDYRDLLYWAEYPEDSGTGTKQEMAERYRRLGVPVPEDLR